MIKFLLYITVSLFSLGQIGRLSFLNQQINIYAYEIVLGILLFSLFIKYRLQPLKQAYKQFKSIFVFSGILLFSLLISLSSYNITQNIVALLYLLRLFFYFLVFVYLSQLKHNKIASPSARNDIKRSINIFIVLTIIFSAVQYLFYKDLRNLLYLGWDPHYYRMFGTFFDTSTAGAIYGMIFLYLPARNASKLACVAGGLVIGVMVALTFSRGAYISLGLTLAYVFILKKQWFYIIGFIIVASLIIIALPKPSGEGVNLTRVVTINARLENLKEGLAIFQKNPIFGIGYNHIRYVHNTALENHSGASFSSSFMIILVCAGIFGLLAFVWVIWEIGKLSYQAKILLLFLSIFSLFDNILLHPFILFFLITVLTTLFDKSQ